MNKNSKQRHAIVRVLKDTTSHPSAEWIHEQVKKQVPGIGLATIYRNLRLLKKAGMVSEIHGIDSTTRFDGNICAHYHFYCDGCGRILDLEEAVDNAIEQRVATKTGLKITRHHVELGGLCLECQQREHNSDSRT